jgi:hypothetical protein
LRKGVSEHSQNRIHSVRVPEETGAEDKPHGSAFVNLTPDEEDKAE